MNARLFRHPAVLGLVAGIATVVAFAPALTRASVVSQAIDNLTGNRKTSNGTPTRYYPVPYGASCDASYYGNYGQNSYYLYQVLMGDRDSMRQSQVRELSDSQVYRLACSLMNERLSYTQHYSGGKSRTSTIEVVQASTDSRDLTIYRFIPRGPLDGAYDADKVLTLGDGDDANLQLRDVLLSYANGDTETLDPINPTYQYGSNGTGYGQSYAGSQSASYAAPGVACSIANAVQSGSSSCSY